MSSVDRTALLGTLRDTKPDVGIFREGCDHEYQPIGWAVCVFAIGLLAAVAVSALSALPAAAQAPAMSATAGISFYQTYCTACHGPTAKGDGPLATSLRRRPSDLTAITTRENGVFPADRIFRIIDGRQRVPGHGGPDMPVWGDAFRRSSEGGDEKSVRDRIRRS